MKINNVKAIIIGITLLLGISFINAQNSFYSSYGLGKNYQNASVRMEGLGYSGSAIYDSLSTTSFNPALWHSFQTVSLQGRLDYSSMNTTKLNSNYQTAALGGLNVKLPIGNYTGLAFGIKPSYRVNTESDTAQSTPLDYTNEEIISG